MKITEHHPQFFTATILEWNHLLENDSHKDIIIDSLRFLVKDHRVIINCFVIMSSHLHLIWQAVNGHKPQRVQHSFLKYTAQQIKFNLQNKHPELLKKFYVNALDRQYQIWERNPLSIDLDNEEIYFQKFNYIHSNPVTAGLCKYPEEYKYSSASFYETLEDSFGFLTHCRE